MMCKVSYLFLGAAIGAAVVSLGPQSGGFVSGSAQAAVADAYHQLGSGPIKVLC
jgi:hypothetical protein